MELALEVRLFIVLGTEGYFDIALGIDGCLAISFGIEGYLDIGLRSEGYFAIGLVSEGVFAITLGTKASGIWNIFFCTSIGSDLSIFAGILKGTLTPLNGFSTSLFLLMLFKLLSDLALFPLIALSLLLNLVMRLGC